MCLLQQLFTFKNAQCPIFAGKYLFELKNGDKTCNFLSFYRFPSHSQDFHYLENLAQKNPFLVVAIGDFNVKSSNWYCQDKTSFEGDAIENFTFQFRLHH